MSNQQISVNFRVGGGDALSGYIDSISKKSSQQANEAIKAATVQTDKAREQLAILNKTIEALEKKTRLEGQAGRSIALDNRETALGKNREFYDGKRNDIFSDYKISEADKKERITALNGEEQNKEQKIKGEYRDNLTVLKEQERQAKLQSQLSREQIDTLKQTARENIKAINSGDLKLSEVINKAQSEEEKLVAKLTEEGLREEKKKESKEKGGAGGGNMLNAVLMGEMIRSTGGMLGQIPQAKNELDFVKPIMSMTGMALAGAIGSLLDKSNISVGGFSLGQTNAGLMGMELGKIAGEMVGGSLERAYKGREDLTNRNFALQAFTGTNYGVDSMGGENGVGGTGRSGITGNLSRFGLDYSQTADLQMQLAQKQGSGRNLLGGAENMMGLEKGLGVSREAIFGIIEVQRSSSKENRDFLKTISGVLNAGKGGIFKEDRALLSEFLGKYSQITKEFLKSQTTVGSATGFDVLNKFNSLGGAFSAGDPRSGGIISSINGSLTNPNTDFKKALSFYALRRANPNMSTADLIEEQQKGLSSETYFNSMLDLTDSMGGSENDKRLQFAGMFGLEDKQAFATSMYKGYRSGKFGRKTLQGQLQGGMGAGSIMGMAEDQTGKYTRSTAEIQNDYIDDVSAAVSNVGVKMKDLFGDMLDQLKGYIIEKIKGGTEGQKHSILTTPTKKPYASSGFDIKNY
jgi:hypothetical protein